MNPRRYIPALLSIGIFLSAIRSQASLLSSFGKLLAFALLTLLFLFVVTRSGDISRVLVAAIRQATLFLFTIVLERGALSAKEEILLVPDKPFLTALFQRPPPAIA